MENGFRLKIANIQLIIIIEIGFATSWILKREVIFPHFMNDLKFHANIY